MTLARRIILAALLLSLHPVASHAGEPALVQQARRIVNTPAWHDFTDTAAYLQINFLARTVDEQCAVPTTQCTQALDALRLGVSGLTQLPAWRTAPALLGMEKWVKQSGEAEVLAHYIKLRQANMVPTDAATLLLIYIVKAPSVDSPQASD